MTKLGLEPHIPDSKACALTHPDAHLPWAQIPVLGCSAYQEAAIHPSRVPLGAEIFAVCFTPSLVSNEN